MNNFGFNDFPQMPEMESMQPPVNNNPMAGMMATSGALPIKDAVLAMAYVPMQEYGLVYSEEQGLDQGTLFPDLDKPFTGKVNV